ncbi:peptide-N(4)-(N-acetyl-beta-glucosaminyl)asparagine amidase [Myxozyma melibiosi]|uniref:Peptide:N-glycanase 1 n=1 Tax=Myxozyma melibiosi TaxID=54550 RepID=A0ABR1F2V2_9ASCO
MASSAQDVWIRNVAASYQQRVKKTVASGDDINTPFARQLIALSKVPLRYENSELLDYALEVMPLGDLYAAAEEAHEKDKSWGHQDHLIKELLKWFRNSFFTWVNALKCELCGSDSDVVGSAPPTDQEHRDGANRVEIHQCKSCRHQMRFPRYDDPKILLTFRKGRCGEWANCFGLLCRALGSRTRWIWNAEDHVWTEVYSEAQKRWIHADACETAWDQPKLYEQGWGKKMSYVIAYSAEGAKDVTARYVRNSLPRTKISEQKLGQVLQYYTVSRRMHLSQEEQRSLEADDIREVKELVRYIYGDAKPTSSEESRPRETGAGEWTKVRGEDGTH